MKNVLAVVTLVVISIVTTSEAQAQLFRRSGGCANGQCSTVRSAQVVYSQPSYQSYEQPRSYEASPGGYWVKQCNNGVCSMVWVSTAATPTVSQTKIDTVVRDRPILGGTVVKNVITKSNPTVPTPTVVSSISTKPTVSVNLTLLNL